MFSTTSLLPSSSSVGRAVVAVTLVVSAPNHCRHPADDTHAHGCVRENMARPTEELEGSNEVVENMLCNLCCRRPTHRLVARSSGDVVTRLINSAFPFAEVGTR